MVGARSGCGGTKQILPRSKKILEKFRLLQIHSQRWKTTRLF
jgi:hypothetical protein